VVSAIISLVGVFFSDVYDGESGAGDKLLFLLEQQKVENVIVIVSRWFGGINLGNDRYRNIINIAKELLQDNGYINLIRS